MRLIDADALIEVMHDMTHHPGGYLTMMEIETTVGREPTIGGWISVKDRLPENQVQVLVVKELKSGQRQIGLAYCIREYQHHNYVTGEDIVEPYWVCSGNNNIIYWQELPEIPHD